MEPPHNSQNHEGHLAPDVNRASTSRSGSDTDVDPLTTVNTAATTTTTKEGRSRGNTVGSTTAAAGNLEIKRTISSTQENLHGLEAIRSAAHAARRKLHLDHIHATGPSAAFNPTNIRMHVRWGDDSDSDRRTGASHDEQALLWRSRDNRKGRNSISIPMSETLKKPKPFLARLATGTKEFAITVWKMFTTFPYWDMAFWSGWSYTWGSVLFIISGAWAFTDVAYPGLENPGLTKYGGFTFFFGALLYQVGATVAYLEAVNDGSFRGSAMQRFLEGNEECAKQLVDDRIHSFFDHFKLHHHLRKDEEKDNAAFPPGKAPAPRRGAVDLGAADEGSSTVYMTWRWWPSWQMLKTHHVYEIGYLACIIQLFGATLYSICGVVDLPGVLSSLQDWQQEGAYWVPQIVASVCFLTAALLFTLETQEKWYRPEFTVIGWWIGFWATVGSMGFLLCAIFGSISYDYEWGEYQSDLSSSWGSFAYLLSGLFQWYEATNKRPFQELLTEPGEMKSHQIHPV